jgi:hypothetical protein
MQAQRNEPPPPKREPAGRWTLVCLDWPRLCDAAARGDAGWARDIISQL